MAGDADHDASADAAPDAVGDVDDDGTGDVVEDSAADVGMDAELDTDGDVATDVAIDGELDADAGPTGPWDRVVSDDELTTCEPWRTSCDGVCRYTMVDELACGDCGTVCDSTRGNGRVFSVSAKF